MTDKTSEKGPPPSVMPRSFEELADLIAREENELTLGKYIGSANSSYPTRRQILDIMWAQNAFNFAVVDAVTSMVSNDPGRKAEAVQKLFDELKLTFGRFSRVTADVLTHRTTDEQPSPEKVDD